MLTTTPRNLQSPTDAFASFRAVRDAHAITGAARAVLYALAGRADGATGENAWPSIDTIAAESGLKRTAVKEALKHLQRMGVIRHTGDRAGRSGRPVKVWCLDLARLRELRTNPDDVKEDAFTSVVADEWSYPDPSNGRHAAVTIPETSPVDDVRWPRIACDCETCRDVSNLVSYLDYIDDLPGEPDADWGRRLLEGIAADRSVTCPSGWLRAAIQSKQGRPGDVRRYLRHLWLEHVVKYDYSADRELFTRLAIDSCAAEDEEDAHGMYAAVLDGEIRQPGLYVSGVAARGDESGIVNFLVRGGHTSWRPR